MDSPRPDRVGTHTPSVTFALVIAAAALFVTGGWLIGTSRPRQPDLLERLRPHTPPTISDEAGEWLEGK